MPSAGGGHRPWQEGEGIQKSRCPVPTPSSAQWRSHLPPGRSGQQGPSPRLCSPTGSEVRQGPVKGQAVTEVGVVAVVLELLQGHAPAFRAELLAPVCKQRGVCEGLSLCLLRLGRSLWRKKGQGDSRSRYTPAYAVTTPFPPSPFPWVK